MSSLLSLIFSASSYLLIVIQSGIAIWFRTIISSPQRGNIKNVSFSDIASENWNSFDIAEMFELNVEIA
jgi:hypothetical protein